MKNKKSKEEPQLVSVTLNFYFKGDTFVPSVLTDKQQEFLDWIDAYIKKNGMSPSIAEIARGLTLSSFRSVTQFLDSLQKKGFIKRNRYERRGISIVKPNSQDNPTS